MSNWVIIALFGILILSSLKYDIISNLFSFNNYHIIIIGFTIILIILDPIKKYIIKNFNFQNLSKDKEIELLVNAIENTVKSVDFIIRCINPKTDKKKEYIESAKNQLSYAQNSLKKI